MLGANVTPEERERRRQIASAHLELIRAELEIARAGQKLAAIAHGRMAESTVCRIFQAHDHRISTLIDVADALGCDVKIEIRKRIA